MAAPQQAADPLADPLAEQIEALTRSQVADQFALVLLAASSGPEVFKRFKRAVSALAKSDSRTSSTFRELAESLDQLEAMMGQKVSE